MRPTRCGTTVALRGAALDEWHSPKRTERPQADRVEVGAYVDVEVAVMKRINQLRSAVLALSVLALVSVLPRLASAEIANCAACSLVANDAYVPTIQPALLSLWMNQGLRAAPLAMPTYQASPMTAISGVSMPNSPTHYTLAPVLPMASNWTGGELPNAFHRPWDFPETNYNPAFITSFYQSGKGYTANAWSAPLL